MNYFIKGPMLKSDLTFTNDRIIAGKREFLYSELTSIQITFNPTITTNGVVTCIYNGKTFILAFGKRDLDTMKSAVSEVQNIISSRRNILNTNLRTAKEMYEFCKQHGFGKGLVEKWSIKHFTVIEDCLLEKETVEFAFMGLHNYSSTTKSDNNYAYAITNKRIIVAQQKMSGQNIVTIDWKNINDITMKLQTLTGIIVIDTYKETISIGLDRGTAKNIYTELHNVLDKLQNKPDSELDTTQKPQANPYEDIKKLKELLDMGIITQDEFDLKKKELLGL